MEIFSLPLLHLEMRSTQQDSRTGNPTFGFIIGNILPTKTKLWIKRKLNRHITSKEIELIIKTSHKGKTMTRWLHQWILPVKNQHQSFSNAFKTQERRKHFIIKASITLITSQRKTSQENYRPISLTECRHKNAQQNNREELFNLIKDFYENSTVNIELNVEWLNALLLQWKRKTTKKEKDVCY